MKSKKKSGVFKDSLLTYTLYSGVMVKATKKKALSVFKISFLRYLILWGQSFFSFLKGGFMKKGLGHLAVIYKATFA